MVKSLSRSGNQSLAHRIQYVDKIARAPHLTHQRDLREHVHLFGVDVVNSAELVVAAEFLPRGTCLRWFRGMQEFLGFWIGQKKKFPAIKTQRVGQARHDLIGGMTLAALEMAHVGRRGPVSLCDLLLRQFALTPAVTNHLPKLLVHHRHGSPLLASPRKKPRYGRFSHPHSKNRVAKIPTLPCCRYHLRPAARASASPVRSPRPRCLPLIGSADE